MSDANTQEGSLRGAVNIWLAFPLQSSVICVPMAPTPPAIGVIDTSLPIRPTPPKAPGPPGKAVA